MNSSAVFDQIEKMGDLPSLPQTLLCIQKVATDGKSCADDLADSILKDQALTMRVLKVVNSALYQRRNQEQIRTVRRAVIFMGFEAVRKLALGLSVFDMMSKLSRSPYLATITRHSLVCAGFAQVLAEASKMVAPEEAFVTALVHDIGKVVLLECSPAHMDMVFKDLEGGMPVLEAERRHFGITHDRAGRRLATRWKLPNEMQNAIGDHHDMDPLHPPRDLDPLLGVIFYADTISHFSSAPEEHAHQQAVSRAASRALGIPAARMEEIYARAAAEIADLAACIGQGIGDLMDYGQMVNREGSAIVAPAAMQPVELARRTAAQLDLYRQVGQGIAAGEDANEILGTILDGAVEILGFRRVVLLEVDQQTRRLVPVLCSGEGSQELAERLQLPLTRGTGALALAVLEHRSYHVPMAASPAYQGLSGSDLLEAAHCTGYAVAPLQTPSGVLAVLYGDAGPDGEDIVAEQASELSGLATQAALVLGIRHLTPSR
jgi:HD-like signal output (HDOD) protein